MDIILLLALFLLLYQVKINLTGFSDAYLSRNVTNSIKGFFILFVFFRHFGQYVTYTAEQTPLILWVDRHLRQLLVAPFLFYSGYGVMESIKNKGEQYINQIPRRRIFNTWINFFFVVSLFLIIGVISGKSYSLSKLFLAYTGWDSLGNSNWYIFSIIFLYFFTWISFKTFENHRTALLCTFFLTIEYIICMMHLKDNDGWWYNTVICFPLGLLYSQYKERIERNITKTNFNYFVCSAITFSVFIISYILCSKYTSGWNLFYYQIMAASFSLCWVLLSMKVQIANPILSYLGGSAMFSLYMLQRIPMMYLQDFLKERPSLYFLICFTITLILSYGFNKITKHIVK